VQGVSVRESRQRVWRRENTCFDRRHLFGADQPLCLCRSLPILRLGLFTARLCTCLSAMATRVPLRSSETRDHSADWRILCAQPHCKRKSHCGRAAVAVRDVEILFLARLAATALSPRRVFRRWRSLYTRCAAWQIMSQERDDLALVIQNWGRNNADFSHPVAGACLRHSGQWQSCHALSLWWTTDVFSGICCCHFFYSRTHPDNIFQLMSSSPLITEPHVLARGFQCLVANFCMTLTLAASRDAAPFLALAAAG